MIFLVEVCMRSNRFVHLQLLNFIGQECDLDNTYAGRKEPGFYMSGILRC